MSNTICDPERESRIFEIGLVMAGAISAGAYTAGVMDFLLQALDEWDKAKAEGDAPPHQVKLKVMAGASAGGITAAITTAALCGDITPVTDQPRPEERVNNPLYNSWVERIDIEHLLRNDDLKNSREPVKSLLDSTVLGSIADSALNVKPTARRRGYLPDLLHVILTVTNLRGVPYNIPFKGNTKAGHEMSLHADYMHFAFSDDGTHGHAGALSLDRHRTQRDLVDHWDTLKLSALATGAFPIGLTARELSRKFTRVNEAIIDDYSERTWPIPTPGKIGNKGQCQCEEEQKIPPSWPEGLTENPSYDFLCVDGGALNNEPLELARRILKGDDDYNPRDLNEAKRAVILIDPFPNIAPFDSEYQAKDDLLNIIISLFGSLTNQARFKPDEIALAMNPNVASRFMIAPSRSEKNDRNKSAQFPIASSALGGFGGLLAREFRDHDYFLGRRNCQKFLRDHFVLSEDNPLFGDWKQKQKDLYAVRKDNDPRLHLPIIPLLGSASSEVRRLDWPTYSEKAFWELTKQVKKRLDNVAQRLMRQFFKNFYLRLGAKLFWLHERRQTLDRIMGLIRHDLIKHDLIRR